MAKRDIAYDGSRLTRGIKDMPMTRRALAANRQSFKTIGLLALLGVFAAYALALVLGGDLYAKSLSALLLALVTLPLFSKRIVRTAYVERKVPLLPAMGLIYGLYYALPLLVSDELVVRFQSLSRETSHAALEIAIVGWLAILAGYFLTGRAGKGLKLGLRIDPRRRRRLAISLIAFGGAASLIGAVATLPQALNQPIQLLSLLGLLGLGLLVAMAFRGELKTRTRRVLLWGVVPGYLAMQILGGLTSALLVPIVFFMAIYWGVSRRVPWVILISVIVLAIPLRYAMTEYRAQTWWGGDFAQAGPEEKALLLSKIFIRNISGEEDDHASDSVELMRQRTSQLATLAWVVDSTPHRVPYWNGETYLSIFSSFIPRAVWPDKPEKDLGQRFGHRYALLDEDDTWTSLNFPQLVESYANFGWMGAILVMGLIGSIYRILENGTGAPDAGDGTLVVSAFVLMQLINMESDFSLVFGGLAQSLVIIYFANRLMLLKN